MKTWNVKYNAVIDLRPEFVNFLNGIKTLTFFQHLLNFGFDDSVQRIKDSDGDFNFLKVDFYQLKRVKLLSNLKVKVVNNKIKIALSCDVDTSNEFGLELAKHHLCVYSLLKHCIIYYYMFSDLDYKMRREQMIIINDLFPILEKINTKIKQN